jgi:hypothetical protein
MTHTAASAPCILRGTLAKTPPQNYIRIPQISPGLNKVFDQRQNGHSPRPTSSFPPTEVTAGALTALDDYFALFENRGVDFSRGNEYPAPSDQYSSASSEDGFNPSMDFWTGCFDASDFRSRSSSIDFTLT